MLKGNKIESKNTSYRDFKYKTLIEDNQHSWFKSAAKKEKGKSKLEIGNIKKNK